MSLNDLMSFLGQVVISTPLQSKPCILSGLTLPPLFEQPSDAQLLSTPSLFNSCVINAEYPGVVDDCSTLPSSLLYMQGVTDDLKLLPTPEGNLQCAVLFNPKVSTSDAKAYFERHDAKAQANLLKASSDRLQTMQNDIVSDTKRLATLRQQLLTARADEVRKYEKELRELENTINSSTSSKKALEQAMDSYRRAVSQAASDSIAGLRSTVSSLESDLSQKRAAEARAEAARAAAAAEAARMAEAARAALAARRKPDVAVGGYAVHVAGVWNSRSAIWYMVSPGYTFKGASYGGGHASWISEYAPSNQRSWVTYQIGYSAPSSMSVVFFFNTDNQGSLFLNGSGIGSHSNWGDSATAYGTLEYGGNLIQLRNYNWENGGSGGVLLSMHRRSDMACLLVTNSAWRWTP